MLMLREPFLTSPTTNVLQWLLSCTGVGKLIISMFDRYEPSWLDLNSAHFPKGPVNGQKHTHSSDWPFALRSLAGNNRGADRQRSHPHTVVVSVSLCSIMTSHVSVFIEDLILAIRCWDEESSLLQVIDPRGVLSDMTTNSNSQDEVDDTRKTLQ